MNKIDARKDDIDDLSHQCTDATVLDIRPYYKDEDDEVVLATKKSDETDLRFSKRLRSYVGQLNHKVGRLFTYARYDDVHPLLGMTWIC